MCDEKEDGEEEENGESSEEARVMCLLEVSHRGRASGSLEDGGFKPALLFYSVSRFIHLRPGFFFSPILFAPESPRLASQGAQPQSDRPVLSGS